MAVNITLNGKFASSRNPILDDKEQVKKDMEKERRKMRLLQVREESKNMSRKIRKDVSAEKCRQLRNLEAIKAQELNCWRENVLAHRNHDYRASIFQVGQAHYAAQVENCERASRPCQRRCCWPVTRPCHRNNVENHQPNTCPPKKSISCAQTQTTAAKRTQTRTPERKSSSAANEKPKRTVCFHDENTNCCICYSTEEPDSPDSPCEYSLFDSSSCSSDLTSPRKCMRTQAPSLCKTPAVCLDIEVDSNDSTCVRQADICDKFAENNRQFCRTIRSSPPRLETKKQNEKTSEKKSPIRKPVANIKTQLSEKPSTSKAAAAAAVAAERPKRFTQISDLIGKKKSPKSPIRKTPPPPSAKSPQRKSTPPATPTRKTTSADKTKSPGKRIISPTKAPPPVANKLNTAGEKPKSPTKSTSPQRKGSTATIKSSQATSASDAPTTSAPTATLISTLIDATTSNTGLPPSGSATDRVQFYDYNNKFSKEYAQPSTITVRVRPSERCMQPNAMEQACIEQQLRASREQDMERLRQKSEERGKKAIEREQVRRDCNELTQKLETLMRQHPELIPTDAKLMARHRFTDKAARKETKMNTAIEEILLRPAIITCPEISRSNAQGDAASSIKAIPSDVNLGAPHHNLDDNNSASTDSCCSILLGYVNDQSKQIRNELNAYETRPQLQNEDKSRKLKNLLDRIEQLRDALQQELESDKIATATSGKGGDNIQQMIESISDLRKERETILLDDINQQQQKHQKGQASQMSTTAREKELKQKEAILEQKVREFYKKVTTSSSSTSAGGARKPVSKGTSSSSGTGGIEFTAIAKNSNEFARSGGKPLEIIIKVKGDPNCVEISEKPKPSKQGKSPRRVSTLIQQSSSPGRHVKKASKKRLASSSKTKANSVPNPSVTRAELIRQQNSYDSNSTSYRSPPPTLGNQVDELVDRHIISSPDRAMSPMHTRINPLITHYIQRLLGMTRNSVQALSVSSSQVETPSSSVINNTGNVTSSTDQQEQLMQERLVRVERFVEENRSFINELEETLRAQDSHVSLETSLRVFEDIWRQRLQHNEPTDMAQRKTKSLRKTPEKKRSSLTKRKLVGPKLTRIDKGDVTTPTKTKEGLTKRTEEINRRMLEEQSDSKISKKTGETNRRVPSENLEARSGTAAHPRYADTPVSSRSQEKNRSQHDSTPTQERPTRSGLTSKEASRIPQRLPVASAQSSGISRDEARTKEKSHSRPLLDSQYDTGPVEQRSADSTQEKNHSRLVEKHHDSGLTPQRSVVGAQDKSIQKIGSKTREMKRSELIVESQLQQRSADRVSNEELAKSGSKIKEGSRGMTESRPEPMPTSQKTLSDSVQSIGISKSSSKTKDSSSSQLLENQYYSDHVQPIAKNDSQTREFAHRPTKPREVKIFEESEQSDLPSTSKTSSQQKRTLNESQSTHRADKAVEARSDSPDAEKQIARYAQLTDNCTNRIAELNELINKVREEKQRLLEVTLSSVSENGTRISNEYLELPDGRRISASSGKSSDQSQSRLLDSNIEALPADDSAPQQQPLEKHKQTGLSRDSGISMSRPQTAQEQLNECEPISYSSTTQSYSYSTSSQQRKTRPPPTLRRFSPQLIEDELAHELSTIMEVDTPVTSRINTSVRAPATTTTETGISGGFIPAPPGSTPVSFPTFEEYLQQLNLDITHIQPEQSMRIEHEFNELVAALKEARDNSAFNYVEFPSLTTYLQDVAANECNDFAGLPFGHDNTPETIENLLACLRIANLTIKSFPSPNTYRQRLRTNTPEGDDECNETTESTEIVSGGAHRSHNACDSESESINIEEELKRRNILKNSFCRTAEKHLFSSTHHEGQEGAGRAAIYAHLIAATESGIEKLSTSDNISGDLEQDLRGIGMQWPAAMRRKGKEAAALSSSTSTSATLKSSPHHDANQRSFREAAATSIRFSADEQGRSINLRDFLTKELLKHSNSSCTSSNTDDSLRSHFFQSILGNITPTCTPRTNTAAVGSNAKTLDRQKTSTPVVSYSTQSGSRSEGNTTSTSSAAAANLFSGESRLSSVHFQDRTEVRSLRQQPQNNQQRQPQQIQRHQQDPHEADCSPDPWDKR